MGILLTATILYNLNGTDLNTAVKNRSSNWVRALAVTPAWIGAFALSSHLWANAPLWSQTWSSLAGLGQYSTLFFAAWRPWRFILSSAGAAFLVIAFVTLKRHKFHALWISLFCTLVLYLELVAIFLLFRILYCGKNYSDELAFVSGPSLVLLAFAVCVLLLIGFTGETLVKVSANGGPGSEHGSPFSPGPGCSSPAWPSWGPGSSCACSERALVNIPWPYRASSGRQFWVG